jgi:hypothetical protein
VPIDHARDKAAVREKYVHHLEQVDRFLSSRRCFQTICLDYRQVVGHPAAEARRLGEFLGRAFDATRAAGAVEGRLYRKRAAAEADPA